MKGRESQSVHLPQAQCTTIDAREDADLIARGVAAVVVAAAAGDIAKAACHCNDVDAADSDTDDTDDRSMGNVAGSTDCRDD